MAYEVRPHTSESCPDLGALEVAADAEGHTFVARTRLEWESGVNRFDREGEAFFVVEDAAVEGAAVEEDGQTIGMCGINNDPYVEGSIVGRLRHLYILPVHRRSGIAVVLVERCLLVASESFDTVRLRTSNPAADALYRSLGFKTVEHPTATHVWQPS